LWRGWTAKENADAYEQFLLSELFPSMRSIPGFRGADVLRRVDSDEVAFLTLTRFDSLDDIASLPENTTKYRFLSLERSRCSRTTTSAPSTSTPPRSIRDPSKLPIKARAAFGASASLRQALPAPRWAGGA
jgi:hypothetical protein